MHYSVKTVYGVSEAHYQGTIFEPLFWAGHDSSASSGICLALVVRLLNSFDKFMIQDSPFADPWEELVEAWNAFASVDGT
jgi:hypothetical protein